MKNFFFLTVLSLLLIMVSCGGDSGPEINLTSPSDGDTFLVGGTISLGGTVTDDTEVSALSIVLTGDVVTTYTIDLSAATDRTTINLASIQALAIDTTVIPGDYVLTITATDNDSNSTEESLDLTIQ
jgi:hypothetical protein